MLTAGAIGDAFQAACHAELQALKPGNVHVHSPGHGMEVAQFEAAAAAAAPHIAAPALKVGERVRRTVAASWAATGCNTNLGILLLCAPLARAAETVRPGETLRAALGRVLAVLDQDDATQAFAAIAHASPAGLGAVPQGDVHQPATMTLGEAMRLAAPRDRIARAYGDDFADLFEVGLPALERARSSAETGQLAVTTLHMTLLARFPDSHIARKHGDATAERVRADAACLAPRWQPAATPADIPALLAFDQYIKGLGLNPGTTADIVVATLFADFLHSRLAAG